MKKTFLNVYFILITSLIVFFSVMLFLSFYKGQTPNIFGYEIKNVTSGSMEPTIKTGSLIVVKPITTDELQVNDIITFKDNENKVLTTHRIVDVINDNDGLKFKTKGDANEVEDNGYIPSYAVVGKVIFKISFLGAFFSFLKEYTIVIIILAFFVVLVLEKIKNSGLKKINAEG